MKRIKLALTLTLLALALPWPTVAQPVEGRADDGKFIVGTKEAPPFAMKGADGRWTGMSIALWQEVADQLDIDYEFREYDLPGLLAAVGDGSVDAAVAALTATGKRELAMDFTHPFYNAGLGIAVTPLDEEIAVWSAVRRFFSLQFLQALGLLVLTLLVVGTCVWLVERRASPEQFGGSVANGIWSGFWWAAVTMTTVGYGDKSPKTFLGRVLGLIWMFTAIVLIGSFIAGMSSALTVSRLGSPIRGPEDLPSSRVATVTRSTSEAYLRDNRIAFHAYSDLSEALAAVAAGKEDVAVYDAPLLQYEVSRFDGKMEVLPGTFDRQDYCIALPTGSALREPINRILLADSTRSFWRDIVFKFLEEAPAPPARPQN